MSKLSGKRVAILATDGFEQSELAVPHERLSVAGATVTIISPEAGKIRGWKHTDWGDSFTVDLPLREASVEDFDCLVLPGGQINPDKLRAEPQAVEFVREFFNSGKPVAAICHGPWLLVEADLLRGRRATSYHSIKTDVRNAGADWIDEAVVADNGIITSRKPDDLEEFCDAIASHLAENDHVSSQHVA